MKYDHIVKHNGIYYAAGQDVPENEGAFAAPSAPIDEMPVNATAEIPTEDSGDKKYTKTEINRMTTAELQNLAAENGIDDAYAKSGGELKKSLIELFGL